jgi:hypothetical protein
MLKSDCHILATCQQKDKWEDMKVTGVSMDGPKRISYYFDTVIEIIEGKKRGTWQAYIRGKDRSGVFQPNEEIPWSHDKEAADFLQSKWGDLTTGPGAVPVTMEVENPPEKAEDPPVETQPKDNLPIEPGPNAEDLLKQVVMLKKNLRITDPNDWAKLIKPFSVNTAKDMTVNQLAVFVSKLKSMLPT